jgi:nitroreductase
VQNVGKEPVCLDCAFSSRNVRMFSDRPVPFETIEWIIRAAGSAPSGANKQPWRFVVVGDPGVKKQIREAAEAEEREFYHRRATPQWLKDLAPLGTDEHERPYLLIPVGYPADDCLVPAKALLRRPLDEVMVVV